MTTPSSKLTNGRLRPDDSNTDNRSRDGADGNARGGSVSGDVIDPDSPEGLVQIIEKCTAILANPQSDWYTKEIHRTKKRCAEDRQGLMMLMHPAGSTGMRPPNLNDFGKLLERCTKLFDGNDKEGKDFLDTQLKRCGVDPETLKGLDWQRMNAVIQCVAEMEQQVRSLKPKRTKPDVVLIKKEIPKPMGLFKTLKSTDQGVVNTSDGEVVAPTNKVASQVTPEYQNELEQARKELGLGINSVKTRNDFLAIMRERSLTLLEYCMVKQESEEILAHLSKKLERIDAGYKDELKVYFEANKETGKKTLTSIYGDLGEKFQKASFSLGDRPEDIKTFEHWLISRDPDMQKTFGVVKREYYDRDMKKVHDWWESHQGQKPVIPGTVTKEAGDRFSIRPSLDTVKGDTAKYVSKHRGAASS